MFTFVTPHRNILFTVRALFLKSSWHLQCGKETRITIVDHVYSSLLKFKQTQIQHGVASLRLYYDIISSACTCEMFTCMYLGELGVAHADIKCMHSTGRIRSTRYTRGTNDVHVTNDVHARYSTRAGRHAVRVRVHVCTMAQ